MQKLTIIELLIRDSMLMYAESGMETKTQGVCNNSNKERWGTKKNWKLVEENLLIKTLKKI